MPDIESDANVLQGERSLNNTVVQAKIIVSLLGDALCALELDTSIDRKYTCITNRNRIPSSSAATSPAIIALSPANVHP